MTTTSPNQSFSFALRREDIRYVGSGLSRPECVLVERDGTLWMSDDRAAVNRINPDGRQQLLGSMKGAPNGLAMDQLGRLYVANMDDGRVYRVDRDGTEEVLLAELDGHRLGSANFPYFDAHGRLWVSVSTTTYPRSLVKENPTPDGYILAVEESGPRRVTDGLLFTNEIRIDAMGEYLYVAETTAGHVSRQALSADGSLGRRQPFGPSPLFPGAATDGIALDTQGNVWVTELTRNALVVISPDGTMHTVFEDPEGAVLDKPSSLAFGGEDLRTVYVGSLTMDRLAVFTAPWPGQPMYHWRERDPALVDPVP